MQISEALNSLETECKIASQTDTLRARHAFLSMNVCSMDQSLLFAGGEPIIASLSTVYMYLRKAGL